MMNQKKKILFHKNSMAPPRSPNHTQLPSKNNNKSRFKSKSSRHLESKNSKDKPNIRLSNVNRLNPIKHKQLLSPQQKNNKKSTSKSKSLKKSKAEPDPTHRSKNLYTQEHSHRNFLDSLTEKSFEKLRKLKFDLLSYIFKFRLVKDAQYNALYEQLVHKFPHHEEVIKKILFEIVSSLDS